MNRLPEASFLLRFPIFTTRQFALLCGRRTDSAIGRFELIRIQPSMMTSGYDLVGHRAPYPLACAEKALLDTLYIATRRGRRFARLPELELDTLDEGAFRKLLEEQVKSPAIRSAIRSRFEALVQASQNALS